MKVPDNSEGFIYWLFNHRCIGLDGPCYKWATEINEIEPRSSSKHAIMRWKNRVPMCSWCHSEYHARGVSEEAIKNLKERRASYLEDIDREQYI